MNITTIGGGKGSYNLLKSLKDLDNTHLSSIVAMSDDGSSTGKLRDEYGILPTGDIRRSILALAEEEKSETMKALFNYRFRGGVLDGHNLGNFIMMALVHISGSYGKSIDLLEELFDIKGKVYPVTFEKVRLIAQLEDDKYIIGEKNIDEPKHDGNIKIKTLNMVKNHYASVINELSNIINQENKKSIDDIICQFINDVPYENNAIEKVIEKSDYIIFSPGDLYTSIIPNLIVGNMKQHIINSKAKKILVINLFTKYGETTGFKLSDFLDVFKFYMGKDIFDHIIVHDRNKYSIEDGFLKEYENLNSIPVLKDIEDSRIINGDFLNKENYIHHDSSKLKAVFKKIFKI